MLALMGVAHAQTTAPTSASLNATAGPLSIASSTVSSLAANGFGGGTIYYPTTQARYGVIAISPGFTATETSIAWLGRRIATHGFVVITLNTLTTLDQPASRANQSARQSGRNTGSAGRLENDSITAPQPKFSPNRQPPL